MPLPSPYRNPGRWRAVVFRQEVRHGTAGCLLSLVLLAPLLVRECGLTSVVAGVVLYSSIIVPVLTGYFSLAKLLLCLARSSAAVFLLLLSLPVSTNGHATLRGWAASLPVLAARVARGLVVGVKFFLICLVRACVVVPLGVAVGVAAVLHQTFMALHGVRITANQVVFFLMVQEMATPRAHLTALYFVLFYTVLLYIYRALIKRQWTRSAQVGQSGNLARLAVQYIAARLGRGVAMSFVMVMFSLQFSHVEPDLTFIAVTFPYFMLTHHRWSGEERIIAWIRALRLPLLEEEEDFWVPLGALTLPVAASVGVGVMVAPARPWLAVVAAYTNLVVPCLLAAVKVAGRDSPHAAVLTACRRATQQEVEGRPTCPVCLEEMRQARVTPCRHLYHAACLASCLAHSALCPLCKQPI